MRRYVLLFLVLVSAITSNCGSGVKKTSLNSVSQLNDSMKAVIVFNKYEHDFGKVAEGEKIGYTFTFENNGKSDLVIISATTTCGCTVPKYDTSPISPKGAGKLEVVFDTSGRNGMQTKTITVKSNASNPVMLLKITAEVVTNN
jgi:hypothetical protein